MDKTKVTKDLENKTLTIERTFNATPEKVWEAYANKDLFVQWWGPEGWETTVKEFDFRPGGSNHYCMKCVDKNQGEWYGQESWGMMRYESVDQSGYRFTYKDYFSDADGKTQEGMPVLTVQMELVAVDGKTNLVSRLVADSAEDIEKLVNMGMVEGFSSSAEKLERLLA
jgi:uncharacterized protein YndB with AHSA1/START domain